MDILKIYNNYHQNIIIIDSNWIIYYTFSMTKVIKELKVELDNPIESYMKVEDRENDEVRTPYEMELILLDAVRRGDLESFRKLVITFSMNSYGVGRLSDNIVKQTIYLVISNTAITIRAAIEGGLPQSIAYNLADEHIRKIDSINDSSLIYQDHIAFLYSLIQKVKDVSLSGDKNSLIKKAERYIYDSIYSSISLNDVSGYLKVTSNYLSTLFRKETGVTITSYIMNKKIEEAKKLLKSDKTSAVIASTLCFASQSYFICCFKRITGMTPNKYRNKSY